MTLHSSFASLAWMRPGFARTKTSRRWPFRSGAVHHAPASTTDVAPPNRAIGGGDGIADQSDEL
ncbi:MAG: hypothetical protein H6672_13450 [Anaerolineaceae bacterium]|nr:hypothetical protein [Anaerolineaceae bacterium]